MSYKLEFCYHFCVHFIWTQYILYKFEFNQTVNTGVCLCVSRLRSLEITDNPLTCTCDNAWFKNWAIHNTDTQVQKLQTQ